MEPLPVFHIGRSPSPTTLAAARSATRQRQEIRHQRQRKISVKPFPRKFYPKHSSWILGSPTMNYFQKQYLDKPFSFQDMYLASTALECDYPIDSVPYSMVKGKMTHDEIKKSLMDLFLKNQALRYQFRRVLVAWKKRKFETVNDIDLVTQEVPVKPVLIYNWEQKKIHIFEASTLLKDSTIRLLNHDNLFLNAQMPRNPFTNKNLSYGNLITVHMQLLKAGHTNWIWEAFAKSGFQLHTFLRQFEVPLKLHCLNAMIKLGGDYDTQDMVVDFIVGEYRYHEQEPVPSDDMLFAIIRNKWNDPSLQRWVVLCKREWQLKIQNSETYLRERAWIHFETKPLVRNDKYLWRLFKSIK